MTDFTLSEKDHNVKAKGYYVGKDFFEIFSFRMLQGNPSQVLVDKLAIVVSSDLAVKLFGTADNAIGKTVEVQHDKTFHVTGVFEGTLGTSSIQFDLCDEL